MGAINNLVNITGLAIAHLHDARARFNETTQDRLFTNDARVIVRVSCGGHHRDEGVEIGGTTDAGDLTDPGELGGNGDGIRRFTAAIKIQDGIENDLVSRAIKIRLANFFNNISDGIFTEQHGAEDGLFGGNIMRWRAIRTGILHRKLSNAHCYSFLHAMTHLYGLVPAGSPLTAHSAPRV